MDGVFIPARPMQQDGDGPPNALKNAARTLASGRAALPQRCRRAQQAGGQVFWLSVASIASTRAPVPRGTALHARPPRCSRPPLAVGRMTELGPAVHDAAGRLRAREMCDSPRPRGFPLAL